MTEILIKRKINCGKKLCGKCMSNIDPPFTTVKEDFYCAIFGKGLEETNEGIDSLPLRLPECIQSEVHG